MTFNLGRLLRQCLALSAAAWSAFFLIASLEAAPKNNNNNNRIIIKKGNPSELPVVKSVSKHGIKVAGKYYEVDSSTDITVNGEKGSLSDIKVGMQALVVGRVKDFGTNSDETVYTATRITARIDNELSKKANDYNKKVEKQARQYNKNMRNK